MDDRDHIGEFLSRVRDSDAMAEHPLTKSHRVESRVSDTFWCHCGRNFKPIDGTHFAFAIYASPEVRSLRC